jgi:polyhydroxyalkanoate synthase
MIKRQRSMRSRGKEPTGIRAEAESARTEPASTEASVGKLAGVDLRALAATSMRLYAEWAKVMAGVSERELPVKDARFADPAWREHPMYLRLAQGYLAFCEAADKLAEGRPDWRKRERARFLTSIITSSLAPTNTLVGNPAALRRVFETGGLSLLEGARNMLGDWVHNKGMPSQVKPGAFKVGENLAMTAGAVVFRNEMVELIQYQPTTSQVCQRPTLIVAPPIGKYYFLDLTPGRSFVQYAVSRGIPVFITSWRNPQSEHGGWGLDDYVQACLDLVEVVGEIAGSKQINTLAMCGGGIINSLMLAVMAARGDKRVTTASFGVMLLDWGREAPIHAFNARPVLSVSRRRSAAKGILPASSLDTVFAWMRPNDLVWNYWSNNYLMGKDPPVFDILAWSVDSTNIAGRLHGDFLKILTSNPLVKAGGIKVLGEPIDISRVDIEVFATGALTDHLTPWKVCYHSAQLFGGKKTFVLSNSGHIGSLVNPPGNPRATYWAGPELDVGPDVWLAKAEKRAGTWWDVWVDWSLARGGRMRRAPSRLGSRRHPPMDAAPGKYVLQKA